MYIPWAGEMTQWLKAYFALAEDGVLVLSTHVRWLITTCNLGSKGSDTFFWPLQVPAPTCTSDTDKCIYISENEIQLYI